MDRFNKLNQSKVNISQVTSTSKIIHNQILQYRMLRCYTTNNFSTKHTQVLHSDHETHYKILHTLWYFTLPENIAL